jgi:hypothetical protein
MAEAGCNDGFKTQGHYPSWHLGAPRVAKMQPSTYTSPPPNYNKPAQPAAATVVLSPKSRNLRPLTRKRARARGLRGPSVFAKPPA